MPKGDRELYLEIISAVKARDVLYDANKPGYKDRVQTDCAWLEVANIVGLSPSDVRRIWTSLRSSYNRCINIEETPVRPGDPPKTTWYLAPYMSFLRQHLQQRPVTDRSRITVDMDAIYDGDRHSHEDDNLLELDNDSLEPVGSEDDQLPAYRESGSFDGSSWHQRLQIKPGPESAVDLFHYSLSDRDVDSAFFGGLLPTFKLLSGKKKRQVQRQILEIVHSAIDKQEEGEFDDTL